MADKRIIEYTEAASAGADYYLVTDSLLDGVKKIKPANIVPAYTGDVTSTAGGTVNTIAANAVTNVKAAQMAAGTIKSNLSGALASASDNTINAVMDAAFGSTQGAIAYRGASGWSSLAPGTSGQFMQTSGPSANPIWQTIPGGGNMLSSTYDPTGKLADAFNSANTQFLQLGTGAASRSLLDRGRDTVNAKDFGAVGDSVSVIATCTMPSGQIGLTATGASFTAADIGKTIVIPGAGAAGAALHTTIAAVYNSTQLDTANNAVTSISGLSTTLYYGTDNYTAITNAYAYCISTGKTLEFTAGSYGFGTKIEFATMRGRVIAGSVDVTLQFFGSGVAISWDGLSYNPPPGVGVYRCEFGGPLGFMVQGNPDCTHLVYVNNVHHSHFKFRGRDCKNSVLKTDALYSGTPGSGAGGCVLTTFDVRTSGTADYKSFATAPAIAVDIDGAFACVFENLNVEQATSQGVQLATVQGCVFNGGSVENNVAGLYMATTCNRNTFIGMHNEANGSITPDFNINGDRNTFIGCHGVATAGGGLIVAGDRNIFQNCEFAGVTINSGKLSTKFDRCKLSGTIADSGTGTIFDDCDGIANNDTGVVNLVIANGAHAIFVYSAGYYKITVAEYVASGQIAEYMMSNGNVFDVMLTGGWVTSTTTPAAGKFTIAYDSVVGGYAVYNNQGSTCSFAVKYEKIH